MMGSTGAIPTRTLGSEAAKTMMVLETNNGEPQPQEASHIQATQLMGSDPTAGQETTATNLPASPASKAPSAKQNNLRPPPLDL